MGGDTLGSMQQSSPTNLTVEATISLKVIKTLDPICCSYNVFFVIKALYVNLRISH